MPRIEGGQGLNAITRMDIAVGLSGISKSFGSLTVLDDVNLTVAEGSFTSLLGPSGCGKTTLLNIIGGLDRPTAGEIRFGSDPIYSDRQGINVPTEHRNIGYVFQSYALWPHMTVLQNVGYALKIRRAPAAERQQRSREMLEKLELGALADRYPFQLSGGQQQRVAIARSLVYRPRLLLLDEPLSNLDAQLRERARAWLRSVHESFGLTTILVTHDQSEALSMSDQVVLLSRGSVEQVGTAAEVYERPLTAHVAEFVGGANLIHGRIGASGTEVMTEAGIAVAARTTSVLAKGTPICVAIRPQRIRLLAPGDVAAGAGTVLPFTPRTVLYQGSSFEITGSTPLGDLRVLADRAPPAQDARVLLPAEDCLCVNP
jgi:iron(III) transport system ATP-binding protein